MDKIILYPSAALGLVLLVIYWYRCRAARVEFNQSVIVSAVFQSSGIVCGLVLVAGVFFEDARKLIQEIDLYIFISGLVVLATSLKGVHQEIFNSTKKTTSDSSKGGDDA